MNPVKDQSVDNTLQPPTAAVAVRPETATDKSLEPSFASPTREQNGALPPPNGQPSVARAADMMTASATMPDVMARAQMSIAMQQTVGNARMGELLHTIPQPKAPPPAPIAIETATPAQPPPTVAPPAPAQPVATPAQQPTSLPTQTPAALPTTPQTLEAAPTPLPAPTPAPALTPAPTPATVASAKTAPTTAPQPAAAQKPPATAAGQKAAAGATSAEAPAAAAGAEAAAPAPAAKAGASKPATGGGGKAEAGKAGAAAAEGDDGGAEGKAKGGGREVKLRMPEPPADVTPAARQRIKKVKAAAGQAAATHAALPSAQDSTTQAREAVTEPAEETHARAEENLVVALGARPKPSPKIEELCAKIYKVISSKRPPDEDSLVEAKPEEMAQAAGDLMKGDVQGDVKSVDQSYDPLDKPPAGKQQQEGQPLESPPASVAAPPINAKQATPDAVPAKNVSLDADVEDNKARMAEAGMETEPAKLAQTGPVAEAREAQGELEKTAAEDPAKVLAAQQSSLAKANSDMAGLQQKALDALSNSRRVTVSGTTGQQKQMVGSEEQMRTAASTEARGLFTSAQTQVNALLQPLPKTAMEKWDKGVAVASQQFKQQLKKVADWIEERHSGVGGTLLSIGDYFTGLPGWVTKEYDRAELKFGDDVCNLARDISTEVNGVIMACEALIADARTKITGVFSRLPQSLQAWAAGEQAKLGTQLDALNKHAHEVRDNFDKELVSRASQSVQEVREQVAELRQKAKGLIGRIADAVGRFLDDPVKFIIEALLDLLSIPRAAFWAVVAKIKKAIGDIADDPEKFANNLMEAVGKGFSQFFDNIGDHLIHGFISWLTGGLADAGVTLPRDFSLKSIITFILELMGITWPRIRKLLAKHIGEENVALLEKAYSIVANLVALGPEGIFELLKEKLNPQEILDQIIKAAVDYMMTAVIKAVSARILLLFNPVGAILQALEAIYKVLKWIFTNAARIFRLIETIVNGIADIIAGNIGGMANAVEKALAGLIPPVIAFLADYLGFGDLPDKVKDTIIGFQNWIEGLLDQVIGWLVEKGKALLKAVGLGGEEDEEAKKKKASGDEEVGKTVTFTAAGKGHKLWIVVGGAGAEVQVASDTPETVEQKLVRWESTLDKAGERKEEAKTAIEVAKGILKAAKKDADEAVAAKEAVKSKPENAEAGDKFQQADNKTEAEEVTLGATLKTLFEIFGEKETILVLLGEKIVERGKTPEEPDKKEEKFAGKVVAFGYDFHFTAATKRFHLQKSRREGEKPDVYIDKEGKLQEGSIRVFSAEDADKIKVYNRLLKHAELEPLEGIEDAETYKNKMRALIITTLVATPAKADPFMVNSKKDPEVLGQYNRLRGDIYDSYVRSKYNYNSPGPLFTKFNDNEKRRCPKLEADFKRQPDGYLGNELYEVKGHTGVGPDADAKQQFRDNITIITEQYLDKDGGGPYVGINYIIRDFDVRPKWEAAFKHSLVKFLP